MNRENRIRFRNHNLNLDYSILEERKVLDGSIGPLVLLPVESVPTNVANEEITVVGQFANPTSSPMGTGEYKGLTIEEAQPLAKRNGVDFRFSRKEDGGGILTADYPVGRITSPTFRGVVVNYHVEGANRCVLPLDCPAPEQLTITSDSEIISGPLKELDKTQGPRSPSWTGEYLGLTVDEAEALAEKNGVRFRIARMDDQSFMLTMDYWVGRITAEVEKGVIVDYTVEEENQLDMPPDCPEYWPPVLTPVDVRIIGTVDVDKSVQTPRTPSWTGEYLGLTVDEAEALAEKNGVRFRIARMDDQSFMLTMDYCVGRITAEVEKGIIVKYTVEEEN